VVVTLVEPACVCDARFIWLVRRSHARSRVKAIRRWLRGRALPSIIRSYALSASGAYWSRARRRITLACTPMQRAAIRALTHAW
jgi:hypothetical protein